MENNDNQVSKFDRCVASLLDGNGLHSKPTTIETVNKIVGAAETFIVQTVRKEDGESVILKYLDNDGPVRLILPPKVVQTISRHSNALAARARSNFSTAKMKERMAAGYKPTPPKRPAKK